MDLVEYDFEKENGREERETDVERGRPRKRDRIETEKELEMVERKGSADGPNDTADGPNDTADGPDVIIEDTVGQLVVSNLSYTVTEDIFCKIFEAFGPLKNVFLAVDHTGHCKGWGFVQFHMLEHAIAAERINGLLEICGQSVQISRSFSWTNITDLNDDDDGIGLKSDGVISECLLLTNLFDSRKETTTFDVEIKEDVEEESRKSGPLKHIYVDKNSKGLVYVRFNSVAAACSFHLLMDKRLYAGRRINATFMSPHEYEARIHWLNFLSGSLMPSAASHGLKLEE